MFGNVVGNQWKYIPEVNDWVRQRTGVGRIFDQIQLNNIRRDIYLQGGFDNALYNGVRSGRLNRDEFIALQMYQAETERLRQSFLRDGVLDERERRILQERHNDMLRLYHKYSTGDYHPRYQVGGMGQDDRIRNPLIDSQFVNQYGKIYDGIRSGDLTRREYHIVDNKLEAINRYRGYVGDFPLGRNYTCVRDALNYNNYLIDVYRNNWDRRFPDWIYGILGGGVFGRYL